MAKDNPLHQALLGLPLWVKVVLCLVDVIYGADRIVEAAVRKSWMALLVAIVWLFLALLIMVLNSTTGASDSTASSESAAVAAVMVPFLF